MARFDHHKLPETDRKRILKELAESVHRLKNIEEVQLFLEQLLTQSEVVMVARRWQVAKQLIAGDSYLTIRENLHVGLTTIQTVDEWLMKATDQYRKLNEKLLKRPSAKQKFISPRYGYIAGSLGSLRRYYPFTFLLLDLLVQDSLKKKKEKID